jgi:hypothetical protein
MLIANFIVGHAAQKPATIPGLEPPLNKLKKKYHINFSLEQRP